MCQLKGGYSLPLEWIFWTQFPPVNAAELVCVICCWIVARLEHLPSWCDHGTWGNEQRWAEHKTGSRSQHSTVITCTSTQGEVDTSKDSFANTELANPANLARLLRLPLPCTDRDGGYTGPLFRSRIWMFLFRPFAEFALFWESCTILALRKHIFY